MTKLNVQDVRNTEVNNMSNIVKIINDIVDSITGEEPKSSYQKALERYGYNSDGGPGYDPEADRARYDALRLKSEQKKTDADYQARITEAQKRGEDILNIKYQL